MYTALLTNEAERNEIVPHKDGKSPAMSSTMVVTTSNSLSQWHMALRSSS